MTRKERFFSREFSRRYYRKIYLEVDYERYDGIKFNFNDTKRQPRSEYGVQRWPGMVILLKVELYRDGNHAIAVMVTEENEILAAWQLWLGGFDGRFSNTLSKRIHVRVPKMRNNVFIALGRYHSIAGV
jgi:hypothetical protein